MQIGLEFVLKSRWRSQSTEQTFRIRNFLGKKYINIFVLHFHKHDKKPSTRNYAIDGGMESRLTSTNHWPLHPFPDKELPKDITAACAEQDSKADLLDVRMKVNNWNTLAPV